MSLSVSAVSQNSSVSDIDLTPKAAPKLTETEQIKVLADQGRSTQQIATATGLPVTLVASTLGDTSSSTSAVSSASARVALSGRLSVYG